MLEKELIPQQLDTGSQGISFELLVTSASACVELLFAVELVVAAYVSIRQHTSANTSTCIELLFAVKLVVSEVLAVRVQTIS